MRKIKAAPISRTEIKAPGHLRLGEFTKHYGGVFAGVIRGHNGKPDYYLFVPPDAEAETNAAWGGYGEDEPNAKDAHDGLANNIALCESKIEHPAAKFARGLELYDLKDFYLPSREELRLCFINCRELFKPEWYWSSTQYSANSAWIQYFEDGYQFYLTKANDYRVRAVRRLIIQ